MNFKVLQIVALCVPAFASTLYAAESAAPVAPVRQLEKEDIVAFLQNLSTQKAENDNLKQIQQKLNFDRQGFKKQLGAAGVAGIIAAGAALYNSDYSPYVLNGSLALSGFLLWAAFAKKHNKTIEAANVKAVKAFFENKTTGGNIDQTIFQDYSGINNVLKTEYTYSRWSLLLPTVFAAYLGYSAPVENYLVDVVVQKTAVKGAEFGTVFFAKFPKNVTASV